MFKRLQQKWKVSGGRLFLILCTFALGGSLTGYVARRLMPLLSIEHPVVYLVIYIIIVTLLWPLMVLLVSLPLGQAPFFRHYLQRLGRKLFRR